VNYKSQAEEQKPSRKHVLKETRKILWGNGDVAFNNSQTYKLMTWLSRAGGESARRRDITYLPYNAEGKMRSYLSALQER